MSPLVETFNFYLALGGVIGFATAVILIVDAHKEQALKKHIKRYGLFAAFSVSFVSASMALVYSEVFDFVPCGLCWIERVFLFPQVFILAVALYFNDNLVARYGLILSIVGGIVSLYHHYIQMGGSAFIRCPAAGSVDCAKRILFEFDFMTFPLLACAGFSLLAALYYCILRTR